MLGDDGQAQYNPTSGLLTKITTTDPTAGGNDTINVGGSGNAIIGGYGDDTINVGGSGSTILGDNGVATFDPTTGDTTSVTTFTGFAGRSAESGRR